MKAILKGLLSKKEENQVGFEKGQRLYRIEITEDINYFEGKSIRIIISSIFSPVTFTRLGKFEPQIKKGIKGDVITKWGKKYFSPDVNQKGIELFTPDDQPYVLIPYNKIENHYKNLD